MSRNQKDNSTTQEQLPILNKRLVGGGARPNLFEVESSIFLEVQKLRGAAK